MPMCIDEFIFTAESRLSPELNRAYFVMGSSLPFWSLASLLLLLNVLAISDTPVIPGPLVTPECLWSAQALAKSLTVFINSDSSFSTFSLSLPSHVFGLLYSCSLLAFTRLVWHSSSDNLPMMFFID